MQNLNGHKLGNYELRERLGRGGMAEVYKAYQASMDRFVAVKVMLGHLATDDNFIERFKREAQAVGRLRHPHIIQIFDFGIQDDIYYMAMEHVTGGNLREYIVANNKLPLSESLKIAHDLADALIYAHNAGMIHRDLKPANVMFIDKATHNVVLTDFGIARILGAVGITGSGMSVGTPSYMSPEAGRGEDIDERADIYALGIILYEMLVGKVPYDADTPLAVILKHISAPLPTRADYGDAIPEEIERIILKCLAKDRDDRYSSATELRNDLATALKVAPNIAKTDAVKAPQAKTELSPNTSHLEDDAPTTMASTDEVTATIASSSGNSFLKYALGIIGVLVVLGGLYAVFGGSNTDDILADTPIAEVAASNTPESVAEASTDIPDSTATSETVATAMATLVPTSTPRPLAPIAPPQEWNLQLLSWDINPSDERNLEFVTEQRLFDNQLQEAIDGVDNAIANSDYIGYAARTRIAVATGNQETALESAQMMLEIDANNPNGHINLLDALYMTLPNIDYDYARMILEQGQSLTPDDVAFAWRSIPLMNNDSEKLQLFNRIEVDGRGWRFVLFAGEFLYEMGEYQRAIPYLESALALPNTIFNRQDRSEFLLSQSQAHLSYATLYPTIDLRFGGILPENLQNLNLLTNISDVIDTADMMILEGDFEGALDYVNGLLTDDPDNAEALFARAQLYSLGYDEDNISGQDALHLIEIDSNNVYGYIALSDSWLTYPIRGEDGAVDEARSALEQAYELAPENPHVVWRLARLGDWEQQIERMYLAEELGASGYSFIKTMGLFLYEIVNDYERAIPYFETYLRGTDLTALDNEENLWNLVNTLVQAEQAEHALDLLSERVSTNTSTDAELLIDVAYVAYRAGDYEQARDLASTAQAFNPDLKSTDYLLALLTWHIEGDSESAIEQLTALEGEEIYSNFLYFVFGHDLDIDRARISAEAGNLQEALIYYSSVLEIYDTAWLYEERADVHIALGDIASARNDLQTAFDISEDMTYRSELRDRILSLTESNSE